MRPSVEESFLILLGGRDPRACAIYPPVDGDWSVVVPVRGGKSAKGIGKTLAGAAAAAVQACKDGCTVGRADW